LLKWNIQIFKYCHKTLNNTASEHMKIFAFNKISICCNKILSNFVLPKINETLRFTQGDIGALVSF
jgi:hypothetical protein